MLVGRERAALVTNRDDCCAMSPTRKAGPVGDKIPYWLITAITRRLVAIFPAESLATKGWLSP
ncbi:MAG: hypothetical protein RL336_800 [Pseudomonadota bacterium]|jgi:hypothetical protein